jgi:hypothetical protein
MIRASPPALQLGCGSQSSAKPPGLDFDAVYEEIERQYRKAGELEQKIWITYIEEGIGRQEEEFRMKVHIAHRISELADEYRERLYRKFSSQLLLLSSPHYCR